MIAHFKAFVNSMEANSTRFYLVLANIGLAVFALVFANTGFLPFRTWGDFAFLVLLAVVLAFYRPSWAFAFFVGSLVVENINLAPQGLPLALRPYQLLAVLSLAALLWQLSRKQSLFTWPKFSWMDGMVGIFVLAGVFSSLFAAQKGLAFKQSVVALSFALIYLLVRTYVQSVQDLKKVAPFFLGTSLVVAVYAVWQNVRFLHGLPSFEVMPGRPNGTFAEPDWLGVFLVFLLSAIYAILFNKNYKPASSADGLQITNYKQISNDKYQIINKWLPVAGYWLPVVVCFVVLILTVARSAWLGAGVVSFVYIALFVLKKDWRGAGQNALGIFVSVLLALGIVSGLGLTNFQLFNRAQSTGTGLQKITIACPGNQNIVPPPPVIKDIQELANYHCRHINLEEIEQEKSLGNVVLEVERPDPNVGVRAAIYRKVFAQIKAHPVVGIGWGNISSILGKDENGNGLNASNIFLETWLGAGMLGLLALVGLLGYVLVVGVRNFFQGADLAAVFVLLGLVAIVVPNLFNSGIFLGFLWAFLAVAVSLLSAKNIK